jgi:hypothetical protein
VRGIRAALTGLALVGLSLSGAVTANAEGMSAMGGCGEVKNPKTSGAKAHWELSCRDGKIRVSGWVEDTDADGQCAKVKAVFASGNTEFSRAACPKGKRIPFDWAHPGSIASVYLFEYDA